MTRMDTYRALTPGEIAALEASGSTADDWSSIQVAEDFHPSQLRGARLRRPCPARIGRAHPQLRRPQLRHRRKNARRRGRPPGMPRRKRFRKRHGGGRHERERRPHGTDLQRPDRPDRLHGRRLPPPSGARRRARPVWRGGRPTRHAPRKEASAATAASPTAGCCATYVSATGRRSKGSPSSPTARSATFRASASTSRPTTSSRPSMRSSTTVRSSNAAS